MLGEFDVKSSYNTVIQFPFVFVLYGHIFFLNQQHTAWN